MQKDDRFSINSSPRKSDRKSQKEKLLQNNQSNHNIQNISPEKQSEISNQQQQNNDPQSDQPAQKHKSSLRIYLHCMFIACGCFYFGFSLGQLNESFPKLIQVYEIKPNQVSFYRGMLSSAIHLGGIFGALFTGDMLRKYGERITALMCDVLGIFNSLIFLLPYLYACIIGRVIMGLIGGVNLTLVAFFMRQITPVYMSAKTGCFHGIFVGLGILISNLIGLGFPSDHTKLEETGNLYWRFALAFPLITCLLRLIGLTLIFPQNTAQFSLQKNNEEDALKLLKKTYHPQYVNQELQKLQNEVNSASKVKETWKSIFTRKNATKLKLGSVLSMVFQFCGVSAITFYSQIIFLNSTGDVEVANMMSVLYSALYMICSIFSGSLLQKYGRRPLLLWGNFILVVILTATGLISYLIRKDVAAGKIATWASISQITLIFTYIIVLNISCGTAKWVYNADILKGKAIAFATSWNFIAGFAISLLFPIGKDKWGIYTMFFIFAIMTLLCILYSWPKLIETKGLSRLQIEEKFEQLDNKKGRKERAKLQEPLYVDSETQYEDITTTDYD